MGLSEILIHRHRHCDDFFAQAEAALSDGDLNQALMHWDAFVNLTMSHFDDEEQQLFPAFEQETGNTMGPTQVMRSEHATMRSIFEDVSRAIQAGEVEDALGLMSSGMLFIQQHNMKEEQVLYPMLDRVLVAADWQDKLSGENTENDASVKEVG